MGKGNHVFDHFDKTLNNAFQEFLNRMDDRLRHRWGEFLQGEHEQVKRTREQEIEASRQGGSKHLKNGPNPDVNDPAMGGKGDDAERRRMERCLTLERFIQGHLTQQVAAWLGALRRDLRNPAPELRLYFFEYEPGPPLEETDWPRTLFSP